MVKIPDSKEDDRNPYCCAFGWLIIAAPLILAATGVLAILYFPKYVWLNAIIMTFACVCIGLAVGMFKERQFNRRHHGKKR